MVLQPKIMYHLAGIFALALAFYVLIPGIGAFRIRRVWRSFRAGLLRSALLPPLTYADIRNSEGNGLERRDFRFFGRLQAMQDDNTIWLSNGEVSLLVELDQVDVFILSSSVPMSSDALSSYPAQPPQRVRWNKLSSLPEETRIFVSGGTVYREGRVRFLDSPDDPLCVVIYECSDREVLIRGIWSGRQRNEYWNDLTPGSLALGFFSLFIYFFILVQVPQLFLPAVAALTLSCVPLAPLIPPGTFGYYFYRRLWQQGRALRAQRDLLRLPLIFFSEGDPGSASRVVELSTGERYRMSEIDCRDVPEDAPGYRLANVLGDRTDRGQCVLFAKDGEKIEQPADPMAEVMLVPGNPFSLSRDCQKTAWIREISGILLLFFGIAANELLLFLIFSYLVF